MVDKKEYQNALMVQGAANVSGVVYSLAKVLPKIWEEARELGRGTDYVNGHPIVRLYAEQIIYLSGGGSGSSESYEWAYDIAEEKSI